MAATMTSPATTDHNPARPAHPPKAIAAKPPRMSRPPSARTSSRRIVIAASLRRLRRTRLRLDDDRRSVRDDLAHRAGQLGAVEAHREDGVRAHQRGVLHQPVEGLAAGVLEQLGVLVDFATPE